MDLKLIPVTLRRLFNPTEKEVSSRREIRKKKEKKRILRPKWCFKIPASKNSPTLARPRIGLVLLLILMALRGI